MLSYQARADGFATFLTKDSQFDYFLNKGCSIYEMSESKERLIATPKDGFLCEKPQIVIAEKMITPNKDNLELRSDIDFLAMVSGVDL